MRSAPFPGPAGVEACARGEASGRLLLHKAPAPPITDGVLGFDPPVATWGDGVVHIPPLSGPVFRRPAPRAPLAHAARAFGIARG